MGEGAVSPSIENLEVPYDGGQQDDRGFHEKVALFLYIG